MLRSGNKSKLCRAGFTLIELLVAVGIIAGLGALLAQSFFTTTRSATKTERIADVKRSGEFAIAVVERMVRNAQSISAESCTDDGSFSDTSLSVTSPDGGTTTFLCEQVGDVWRIASASSVGTQYLTSSAVTAGEPCSLSFTCISLAGVASRVAVRFALSQKGSPQGQFEKASEAFQATMSIRGQ